MCSILFPVDHDIPPKIWAKLHLKMMKLKLHHIFHEALYILPKMCSKLGFKLKFHLKVDQNCIWKGRIWSWIELFIKVIFLPKLGFKLKFEFEAALNFRKSFSKLKLQNFIRKWRNGSPIEVFRKSYMFIHNMWYNWSQVDIASERCWFHN